MTATPDTLDVERLAEAIGIVGPVDKDDTEEADRAYAEDIAREYAELATLKATYPDTLDVTRQAGYLYLGNLPNMRAALAGRYRDEPVTATR